MNVESHRISRGECTGRSYVPPKDFTQNFTVQEKSSRMQTTPTPKRLDVQCTNPNVYFHTTLSLNNHVLHANDFTTLTTFISLQKDFMIRWLRKVKVLEGEKLREVRCALICTEERHWRRYEKFKLVWYYHSNKFCCKARVVLYVSFRCEVGVTRATLILKGVKQALTSETLILKQECYFYFEA